LVLSSSASLDHMTSVVPQSLAQRLTLVKG
jgi:hypothetical protein